MSPFVLQRIAALPDFGVLYRQAPLSPPFPSLLFALFIPPRPRRIPKHTATVDQAPDPHRPQESIEQRSCSSNLHHSGFESDFDSGFSEPEPEPEPVAVELSDDNLVPLAKIICKLYQDRPYVIDSDWIRAIVRWSGSHTWYSDIFAICIYLFKVRDQ